MLAACRGSTPVAEPLPSPEPVAVACDERCFKACPPLDPVPVDDDGTTSPDALGEALLRDEMALALCETARAACASCLDRAREAKLIK